MGNCIPRKAKYMVAENLVDNNMAKAGEIVGLYKDDRGWHYNTKNGDSFLLFTSHLRNPNYFRIIETC